MLRLGCPGLIGQQNGVVSKERQSELLSIWTPTTIPFEKALEKKRHGGLLR